MQPRESDIVRLGTLTLPPTLQIRRRNSLVVSFPQAVLNLGNQLLARQQVRNGNVVRPSVEEVEGRPLVLGSEDESPTATIPCSNRFSIRFRVECRLRPKLKPSTPAQRIIRYADVNGMDHLVIGSHGKQGIARYLLGSVAETVIRRSVVPITVVRPSD